MDKLKEYIKQLAREVMSEDQRKNTNKVKLTLDDISLKRFNVTPTFKNLLHPNQLSSLKTGENTLIVNNTVYSNLQRMAGPGGYKIEKTLDEESATGAIGVGAGPIMTPYAFSPKGQKKNAATKTAEKQGMKVTKGETEMPADSKVRDYVTLTGKKKKKVKIYHESNYDKASQYGAVSGYTAPSGYTGPSSASKGGGYYATDVKETMEQIIKEELLNEVTYNKFKNEVKFRTKNEQLHKAIREVKRKLSEIDRIVEYTSRMKQELSEGEEGLKYWKKTESNIATISEMVNQLNNKIKNLQ